MCLRLQHCIHHLGQTSLGLTDINQATTHDHTAFLAEKYIYRNSREILSDCCIRSSRSFSFFQLKMFVVWKTTDSSTEMQIVGQLELQCNVSLWSDELFNVDVGDVGPHKLTRTIISSWRDMEVQHSSIKVTLMSRLADWLMTDQDWRIHFAVISRVQRLSISGGLIFN